MSLQKGYYSNIDKETLSNDNFRKVLFTGVNMQLVVMCLKPYEEIGMEIHETHDQFFRIESGRVKAILDGTEIYLERDDVLIVPAGTNHNIINTEDSETKLYTIYAPPQHKDGTVQKDKPLND